MLPAEEFAEALLESAVSALFDAASVFSFEEVLSVGLIFIAVVAEVSGTAEVVVTVSSSVRDSDSSSGSESESEARKACVFIFILRMFFEAVRSAIPKPIGSASYA